MKNSISHNSQTLDHIIDPSLIKYNTIVQLHCTQYRDYSTWDGLYLTHNGSHTVRMYQYQPKSTC